MSSLIWNPKQTARVRMLDDQHGVLFDALNELHASLAHGEACETVRLHLNRLTELTRLHLDSEERLLHRHSYPALEQYSRKRRELLLQLDSRPTFCPSGNDNRQSSSVYELAAHLQAWFTAHSEESGQHIGPWLHQHGVR